MYKPLIVIASCALALSAVSTGRADAQTYHRVCHNVRVKHIQSQDSHRLIGTGVGAVAGGLLGHQIGGGKGNTLATVGGAVAGGVVGNKVQQNAQNKKAYYTTERRCENVQD
jgi:uncharacterized protein YcfJ